MNTNTSSTPRRKEKNMVKNMFIYNVESSRLDILLLSPMPMMTKAATPLRMPRYFTPNTT